MKPMLALKFLDVAFPRVRNEIKHNFESITINRHLMNRSAFNVNEDPATTEV